MQKSLFIILASVAVFYCAICLVMFVRQRSFIYFPQRMDDKEIALIEKAMGFEPWKAQDGTPFGWKMEAANESRRSFILFHGNGGLALERTELVSKLREADPYCSIYLFEYPGYANMAGSPSENAIVALACKAADDLTVTTQKPIYIIGESLGTGVSCAVATQKPAAISGLLLLTPFNSLVGAAATRYAFLPVSLLLKERYDSANNLKAFHKPVAIIVAEKDTTVPAKLGIALFDGYKGPKQLLSVPNCEHNEVADLVDVPEFRRLLQFLQN
ncbi:MAG: alpha/beta hydrolase [Chthoniobacterales bacterium]